MKTVELAKPAALPRELQSEAGSERLFIWIASASTALALGMVVATVQSLHSDPAGLSFQVSAGTYLAFVVGAVGGLLYWRMANSNSPRVRRGLLAFIICGVGLFLYPLRFVPAAELPDLAIGLVTAGVALSIGGYLLWQVKRSLDADARQGELAEAGSGPTKAG